MLSPTTIVVNDSLGCGERSLVDKTVWLSEIDLTRGEALEQA
jgi:hypothetical protein